LGVTHDTLMYSVRVFRCFVFSRIFELNLKLFFICSLRLKNVHIPISDFQESFLQEE